MASYDETTSGITRYAVGRHWATADRPLPTITDPFPYGFNTTLRKFEYWNGATWILLSTAPVGHARQHMLTNPADHTVGALAAGEVLANVAGSIDGIPVATASTPSTIAQRDAAGRITIVAGAAATDAAAVSQLHTRLHGIDTAADHGVGTLADGDALVRTGAALGGVPVAAIATVSTIAKRDAAGRTKMVAGVAADDVAVVSQLPAAGFSRFTWLPQGSTYAVIQAALNNAAYDGVLLEPGGAAYSITADLTIPNGKFLVGAWQEPDPAGTRAILAVGAGFRILVQRGTLSYCNVVWTAGSALPAVVGAGGTCDHVHVSTSAGLTTIYAFSAIFSRVSHCSTVGMSGITITGVPAVSGSPWTIIDSFYASGAGAGAYGIYLAAAPAAYVLIDGARISGGAYGIYVQTTANVIVRSSFITGSTTQAFYANVANYLTITDLTVFQCVSGVLINQCVYFTVHGITAKNITSSGGVVFVSCQIGEISDVTVENGEQYSFQLDACLYVTVNNVTVANSVYAGGGNWAIVMSGTGIAASNLNVYNFTGSAAHVGIAIYCIRSSFRNMVVNTCSGQGMMFASNVSCEFSGLMVYNVVGYGFNISSPENCNFSDLTAVSTTNIGIHISNGLYSNFCHLVARTCGTVGAAGGIDFNSCTSCNASDVVAQASSGVGITFNNTPTRGTYSDFYSSASSTKGIYITGPIEASFSNFNAKSNPTGGIEILNAVKCQISGWTAIDNTLFGIKIGNPTYSNFTGLNANGTILGAGPGHGIIETTAQHCTFTSFTSESNAGDGVNSSGGSYNHWHSGTCSLNAAGTGFNGVAGVTSCLCDGLLTRGNTAASVYGAGWTNINQTAF